MPINISKFMPGIGRDSTDRYSSSNRLFTEPFRLRSAHERLIFFSRDMLLIKYGGRVPVRDMSLLDMVNRVL